MREETREFNGKLCVLERSLRGGWLHTEWTRLRSRENRIPIISSPPGIFVQRIVLVTKSKNSHKNH
jgi:hypothetical protein